MTVRSRLRQLRHALVLGGAALTLAGGGLITSVAQPAAAASLPCDIYAANGYPSDTAENAVQASLASAGYSFPNAPTGPIVAGDNSSDCADLAGGNATAGNKVQMWTCDGNTSAQSWTIAGDGTVQIDGGCMDITGANYNNGTLIEWWPCNGGANQQWRTVNGQIVNPASGKCLDDPNSNTTNGTQLILWQCNGGANQRWTAP
jgi:hypothetical protein